MQAKPHYVKIIFEVPKSDWHNYTVENMWAQAIGDNLFVLKNSPAYVYNVSFEDVVSASLKDGVLVFDKIVGRGGHSTYRIVISESDRIPEFEHYWRPIENLGCTYEGSVGPLHLYVVDVPPNVDVARVYDLLSVGEKEGIWDFEEAHFGHGPSTESH